MGLNVPAVPMFEGKVTASDLYVVVRDLVTTKEDTNYIMYYRVEYSKDGVRLMGVNKNTTSPTPILDVWATAYNHLKAALTADGLAFTDA